MQLPKGAIVAVADGEKLNLFRNTSDAAAATLTPLPTPDTASDNKGSGLGHHSSSANPDDSQLVEDSFAAGVAAALNRQVLGGGVPGVVIIAAPRTLGELRKHYHQKLSAVLLGEIAKDLTGHAVHDVEKAVAAA